MVAHSASIWPGRPAHIVIKIREVEDELDLTWPEWRAKKPFGDLPYDHLARIKWLLKRHSLLTHEEHGIPSPRDWRVIVVPDAKNPSKCYAHTILPERDPYGAAGEPARLVEIPSTEPAPLPSATDLAFTHRLPLEHIETALQLVPVPVPAGLDVATLVVQIARTLAGRSVSP